MLISITQPENEIRALGLGWDDESGPTFSGTWLAELLRWEGSTQFALALSADSGDCGFSKTLVVNSLRRRLNLWDDDLLEVHLKHYFETLVVLQDFGKLGDRKGYIPRESRVTALSKDWVRIAGGLPERYNECPDDAGTELIGGTIGRLAKRRDVAEIPSSWEIKQPFLWETNLCKSAIEEIEASLNKVENLGDLELQYYHSTLPPGVARWNCWNGKPPRERLSVARTVNASPRFYYLVDRTMPTAGVALSRDNALLYLLHSDYVRERHVPCSLENIDDDLVLTVPNVLPSDWHKALAAGSSAYADSGNRFEYRLTKVTWPFFETLLNKAGCKIQLLRHV